MLKFLKLYAIAFATFLLIDFVWLRFVARAFYHAQLGQLMRANINWVAAVVFYLLFVVGIVLLAFGLPSNDRASHTHFFSVLS